MDNTTINIRASKVIETLISIALSVIIGGAAIVVWKASIEQEARIEEAVSQVEARLTAVIETNIAQMKAQSDETKILRVEMERMHTRLLALHDDDILLNEPYLPVQQTFDEKNYKDAINIKQQQYYQQKK